MGKTRASNTEAKLEEKNQKNEFAGVHLFAAPSDDLLASEEKYRLLAENISDVVWVMDAASQKFKYVSPSMEKLLGYSQDEITAKSPEEIIAPESRDVLQIKLPGRVANFLAGDPSAVTKTDELLQFRKDGSLIWTEIVSTLVKNKDGGLDIVGVSRDISKRKQSEKTLRENEEKYRKLAEELEQRVMERTNEIKSVQRRLEIAAQAAELGIWDWNIITNINIRQTNACHLRHLAENIQGNDR